MVLELVQVRAVIVYMRIPEVQNADGAFGVDLDGGELDRLFVCILALELAFTVFPELDDGDVGFGGFGDFDGRGGADLLVEDAQGVGGCSSWRELSPSGFQRCSVFLPRSSGHPQVLGRQRHTALELPQRLVEDFQALIS